MITKQSALTGIKELFERDLVRQYREKKAFTPMYPTGSQDPATKQAADPSAAGMDPNAAPMDPAAAGGAPPMDPAMMQQMMMAEQAPQDPAAQGAPRGEEAAENGAFTGEEKKLSTNEKLDQMTQKMDQVLEMVDAVGNLIMSLANPQEGNVAGGAPAGAPPMDPNAGAMPPEAVAGPEAGGMPPGMTPEMLQEMMAMSQGAAGAAPVKAGSDKNAFARSIMKLLSKED